MSNTKSHVISFTIRNKLIPINFVTCIADYLRTDIDEIDLYISVKNDDFIVVVYDESDIQKSISLVQAICSTPEVADFIGLSDLMCKVITNP